jgi:Acyl-CoA dehydrogenase, C-terminal domain
MSYLINDLNQYREKMNEVILSKNNPSIKRLWNLDANTYETGALDKKKEMPGLVASMVLRCVVGGYGYSKGFPVEKFYRDSNLCIIGKGTSELQKIVFQEKC